MTKRIAVVQPNPTIYQHSISRKQDHLPNSSLPLVAVYSAIRFTGNSKPEARARSLAQQVRKQGWYKAPRAENTPSINTTYHSRAHVALVALNGEGWIHFGGSSQGNIMLRLSIGDIIFIPAGLGYRYVEGQRNDLVIARFIPQGQHLNTVPMGTNDYLQGLDESLKVPLPELDLLSGMRGPLITYWHKRQ